MSFCYVYVYFIPDGQAGIRKIVKFISSMCANNTRELREHREILEALKGIAEKNTATLDKLVAAQMADKLCLDFYLPFQSNEDIRFFMKNDQELHRRKVALREV